MNSERKQYPLLSQDETIDLLRRAQNGDARAREELFKANLGLVYLVMERFKNSGYEYEDLFQIGCMGLVKAIERFDTGYGVRFSTYAVPMIIGEIKRFLRDDGPLKVQRSLKEVYARVKWAEERLRAEKGREPTLGEIADLLGIEREEIVLALEACQTPTYIHELLANQEKDQLQVLDTLGNGFQSDDFLEQVALREALEKLNYREREVILRRFFKDETQSAIAQDLGISQVQVSRIERAALLKLKNLLNS